MAAGMVIAGVLAGGGACGTHSARETAAVAQLSPEQALPQNGPVDAHYIPASKVPVPSPVAWSPRPVVEPANPIAQSPLLHNPGGVNGDRQPRSVLGLAGARPATELRTLDVMPEEAPTTQSGPKRERLLAPANGLAPPGRTAFGLRRAGFH